MPYPGRARGRQKLRLPPLGAALDPEDHTQSNTWQSAVSGASRGERTSSATPAMIRDRISADRTLMRVSIRYGLPDIARHVIHTHFETSSLELNRIP
jgi:hypothetical protein